MKRICVFCGSRFGINPIYAEMAQKVGETLAERGIGLVYGGGNVGLMGVVANAVLQNGGEVIGVITEHLVSLEVGNLDVTKLYIVKTMHERKALMASYADGFLILPGGCGTFDEMFEMVTWLQLRIQNKPCAVLNINGFYDLLWKFWEHTIQEGFVRPEQRDLWLCEDNLEKLLEQMHDAVENSENNPINRVSKLA